MPDLVLLPALTLTSNGLPTAKVRRVMVQGEPWLVAPAVSIVGDSVLPGSQGSLLYPKEECAQNVNAWDGMPVTAYHPMSETGDPVGATFPGVLKRQQIGVVKDSVFDGRLRHSVWINENMAKAVDPFTGGAGSKILDNLRRGKPVEVSTGLYTDNEPSQGYCPKGRGYTAIARNYRPDHLAILPDQRGACSVADGCGLLVNKNGIVMPTANECTYGATTKPYEGRGHNGVPKADKLAIPSFEEWHDLQHKAETADLLTDRALNLSSKAGDDETHADAAKAHKDAMKAHATVARIAGKDRGDGMALSFDQAQYHSNRAKMHEGKWKRHLVRGGKAKLAEGKDYDPDETNYSDSSGMDRRSRQQADKKPPAGNAWSEEARLKAIESKRASAKLGHKQAHHAIASWYRKQGMDDVANEFAHEDVKKIHDEVTSKYPHLSKVQVSSQVARLARQRHPLTGNANPEGHNQYSVGDKVKLAKGKRVGAGTLKQDTLGTIGSVEKDGAGTVFHRVHYTDRTGREKTTYAYPHELTKDRTDNANPEGINQYSKRANAATSKAEKATVKAETSYSKTNRTKAADAHTTAHNEHRLAAEKHAEAGNTAKAQSHKEQATYHYLMAGHHEFGYAKPDATQATESPEDRKRSELREMQDKLLAHPVAKKFAQDHGEHKPLWEGGPSTADMRSMVHPAHRSEIEGRLRDLTSNATPQQPQPQCPT